MRIKGMSEREFIMLFAAVLIGRVHLIGMNPFAVGFFMAMCYERVSKGFFMVALSLGTSSPVLFPEVTRVLSPFRVMREMSPSPRKTSTSSCGPFF